jgi:hypothetical protein
VPDETTPEQSLAGGYVSAVVRVGGTVRRDPGPSPAFVSRLLGLLEQAGFDGAPRYLATDGRGREILSFIDSHVPWQPARQVSARTDASLAGADILLRRWHDLTAGTALAGRSEVACHNDLSPRNTVYRNESNGLRPLRSSTGTWPHARLACPARIAPGFTTSSGRGERCR